MLLEIGATRKAGARRVLMHMVGQERYADLYRTLALRLCCIDDGLIEYDFHKFGIAGAGAGMTDSERREFTLSFRSDEALMRRVNAIEYHDLCAAADESTSKAKELAERMRRELGLNSPVMHAGFSDDLDVRMRRPPGIHPAPAVLLAQDVLFNEGQMPLPTLAISTTHMPKEYIEREIDIARKVIEGPSGVLEVMDPDDTLLWIIAATTRLEAEELLRTFQSSFKKFRRVPEPVLLIRQELQAA